MELYYKDFKEIGLDQFRNLLGSGERKGQALYFLICLMNICELVTDVRSKTLWALTFDLNKWAWEIDTLCLRLHYFLAIGIFLYCL